MFAAAGGVLDLHRGIGVRLALLVENECVTDDVHLAVFCLLANRHQAPVAPAAAVLGDALGEDLAGGVRRQMMHLRPGVLMHAFARVGYGDDFGVRPLSLENHCWVLHRQLRSDVAVDPFDSRVLVCDAPLGDQVVDIVRPVLDGGVAYVCTGQRNELNDGTVQ